MLESGNRPATPLYSSDEMVVMLEKYIQAAKQKLIAARDDKTRFIYAAIVGAAEVALKEEKGLKRMNSRIGQLYQRREYMTMARAVRQAVLMFRYNPHLVGLEPQECRAHPKDLAELGAAVDGLPVVGDESIQQGYVFVCCLETEAVYA